MPMTPTRALLGAGLTLAAVTCAACGTERAREPAREPLVVQIGMFVQKTVLPNGPKDLVGLFTSEPLVAAAWDGRPVFKLAESVAESDDGRTLIVTLQRDARFHRGDPVTAPVVRDLLVKKATLPPEIAGITSIDDRRLQFTLRRPWSLKPEDLSAINVDSNDDKEVALRTGPFKVVSTDPIVLERFESYYLGSPSVQRVEIRGYANHRLAWSGMMRREVNFLHEVSRDAIEFVEAGGDIRAYPLLRPYYTALVFNVGHQVLGRREVRVAINEAIDRNELVKNGMRGHGRTAESPFWPYHWAYPQGRFPTTFNPEAAKLRLEGAGFPVGTGGNQQMPSRFSFTCLIRAGDDRFERIAQLVQRQLFGIGIEMKIEPLPMQELGPRLLTGKFDAFLMEEAAGRILTWAHRFFHSNPPPGYPTTGYAAADSPLDRLQTARTDDEVREALADVMHVMRNDPPAAFLVWPREARAADASFDIPYETDRDVFGSLWQLKRGPVQLVTRR